MLKSLNELYGVKKQQNAHPALAHEVKTSHTVKCIYYVKDFFKIYCTDGGTGHDGQLILLDGKEISYQQLKSLSPDDLLHDVWEILPESTNLESKFGILFRLYTKIGGVPVIVLFVLQAAVE